MVLAAPSMPYEPLKCLDRLSSHLVQNKVVWNPRTPGDVSLIFLTIVIIIIIIVINICIPLSHNPSHFWCAFERHNAQETSKKSTWIKFRHPCCLSAVDGWDDETWKKYALRSVRF
jgi:hypothetical protein